MDIAHPVSSEVTSLSFSYLHTSDIKRVSVKPVVNPVLFDNLNNPNAGGLYDPAFGPLGKGDMCVHLSLSRSSAGGQGDELRRRRGRGSRTRTGGAAPAVLEPTLTPRASDPPRSCSTCHLTSFDCPGHFGHIELPSPVFHPLYMVQAFQLLRGCCVYCHRFLLTDTQVRPFLSPLTLVPAETDSGHPLQLAKQVARLTLLEHGLVTAALELDSAFQGPVPVSKAKARADAKARAAAVDADNVEDNDAGESLEESYDDFRSRLDQFVAHSIRAAHKGKQVGLEHKGRDEYKESGTVFDVRRKAINQFLKSLSAKRRCEHCGACVLLSLLAPWLPLTRSRADERRPSARSFAHRYRKEGHTKILEFSLVAKQRGAHSAMGLKRPKVLAEERLEAAGGRRANGAKLGDDSDAEDDAMDVDGDAEDKANLAEEEEDAAIEEELSRGKQTERIVLPEEVRAHLRRLFHNERDLVTLIYAPHGPLARATASRVPQGARARAAVAGAPAASADMFFMDVVSVPPTRFRPAATMGDQVFENPHNSLLNGILRQSIAVRDYSARLARYELAPDAPEFLADDGKPRMAAARYSTQLYEALIDLQIAVNSMMDSGKNPAPVKQGKLPTPGVKQLLEKKEGLFRKNMMVRPRFLFVVASSSRSSVRRADPARRLAPAGQARQLRRPVRHLARRQHRDERDRRPARLCAQAHVPGTRHGAQHPPAQAGRHQRAAPAPGRELHPDGGRQPHLARAHDARGAHGPGQQAARARVYAGLAAPRRRLSPRRRPPADPHAPDQPQGLPPPPGRRHRYPQPPADPAQAVDDVPPGQGPQGREDDPHALRQLVRLPLSPSSLPLSPLLLLIMSSELTRLRPPPLAATRTTPTLTATR